MADPGSTAAAARRLAPVIRLAPAKLNLTLAILGRRPDGYHDLHTVMVPLTLADRLSVARAAADHDTLSVDGLDAGPAGDNLVLKAIAATRAAIRGAADPFPLAARLEKRIPVAAGLAGGSSDAAAAIDASLEAWGLLPPGEPPDREVGALRARVAARVGSDVPFFLAAGPALVEGRGERVQLLPSLRGTAAGVLLVTPLAFAPTPAVYAAYDGGGAAAPPDPRSTRLTSEHLATELRAGLSTASLVARAGVLATANDLAAAAATVVPGLTSLRRSLARLLRLPVGVSGSGPTLWVLYPSQAAAETAAAEVREALVRGAIVAPGDGPPSIIASSLVGTPPGEATLPARGHPAEGRT